MLLVTRNFKVVGKAAAHLHDLDVIYGFKQCPFLNRIKAGTCNLLEVQLKAAC